VSPPDGAVVNYDL